MLGKLGNLPSFLLLCVIWGTTWIAVKAGLETVPPLFLAGSRFSVAGVILLIPSLMARRWPIERHDLPRLFAAAMSLIVLCYGALFWGMVYVDSGSAAVIEMGLTPIALLGFALLLREESFSLSKLIAIALGLCGLLLLFGSGAWRAWSQDDQDAGMKVLGILAVASAAITYGWGSVISRPLLRRYSATAISGSTTLVGGLVLCALSLLVEPGAIEALDLNWGWRAWAGWLFLVVFGSLIAYVIYMRLLRDIGPSRAGMYCFVSPVIAVGLGVLVRGERIGPAEAAGIIVLLLAAWLAMRKDVRQAEA